MEFKVLDNKGKESRVVQFNESLLVNHGSPSLLHEVVVAYMANKRSGSHSTLTRTEVSGGGIKPWRQKGTGRARAGSIRSPLWRHGGIIHGPKPRSYRQDLPKAKKRLAFKMAVRGLIDDNRLQVVDPIELTEPKTKHIALIYKKWDAPQNSMLILDHIDPIFERASRNVSAVRVENILSLNTYDCLRARRIFITPSALEKLSARIEGPADR